ncbi:hypothetical protein [Herpetosiphon giganteus]|uniref:hypothetical protein n=1 Tax=Herpetosiphon giganteus TaxID=2029754 RepID=UPI00195A626F|nr:hypothetical protein [Herpetosiphon giganteus]MBM7843587.1 hypothetical protein [Herpetosiphon giganteus]
MERRMLLHHPTSDQWLVIAATDSQVCTAVSEPLHPDQLGFPLATFPLHPVAEHGEPVDLAEYVCVRTNREESSAHEIADMLNSAIMLELDHKAASLGLGEGDALFAQQPQRYIQEIEQWLNNPHSNLNLEFLLIDQTETQALFQITDPTTRQVWRLTRTMPSADAKPDGVGWGWSA